MAIRRSSGSRGASADVSSLAADDSSAVDSPAGSGVAELSAAALEELVSPDAELDVSLASPELPHAAIVIALIANNAATTRRDFVLFMPRYLPFTWI
jgi:hypothetical protein